MYKKSPSTTLQEVAVTVGNLEHDLSRAKVQIRRMLSDATQVQKDLKAGRDPEEALRSLLHVDPIIHRILNES